MTTACSLFSTVNQISVEPWLISQTNFLVIPDFSNEYCKLKPDFLSSSPFLTPYHPQTWALPVLWHEGWGFYNGLCQACFLSLSGLFSPKRASWLNNPLVSVLLHQWWDLPHLHRQTPHCSCTPHRAPLGQAASGSRIRILL